MTSGSVDVLVLGLGNPLLGDDGAGLRLLAALEREAAAWGGRVEFVDGGTQGLMLLERIAGRRALLILDAVSLGAQPGTVHVLRGREALGIGAHHGATAHEGNAEELLGAAVLLGECPEWVYVVGIEPARIRTGIGVSETVEGAMGAALEAARGIVGEALERPS